MREQIQEWKTWFLSEKVCAYPALAAENAPVGPVPGSKRDLFRLEDGENVKKSPRARHGGGAGCYNSENYESGAVPSLTQMGNVGLRMVRSFLYLLEGFTPTC